MHKMASSLMLVLLAASLVIIAFKVQTSKADSTAITINPDGSISPPKAPISTLDNNAYILTGNISLPTYDGIVVNKSNIIIDGNGFTVQGDMSGCGLYLSGMTNVTVENTNVYNETVGFYVNAYSNCIRDNNATDCDDGVAIALSNNIVSGNNLTNDGRGVDLISTTSNIISENNLAHNVFGIQMIYSSFNNITGNNITENSAYGIMIELMSYNNRIYHNNFINNTEAQVWMWPYEVAYPGPGDPFYPTCIWDDGYPSGGNYWSDYTGVDLYSGDYQNITGSDGIGDIPYDVAYLHTDHYPLITMQPSGAYYNVTFSENGIGTDLKSSLVNIDGTNYSRSDLPTSLWWRGTETHTFGFESPLLVDSGAKEYVWNSTSGLSFSQSGSISFTSSGSIQGNYVILTHDVAISNMTSDRSWIFQGRNATVTVTVLNKGDFNENITALLYCNITANELIGAQNIALGAGENETLSFAWDTIGLPINQNFTLTSVATVPLDYNPADNVMAIGLITVRMLGDLNGDGKVDIKDISLAAKAFGSYGPNFKYQGSPASPTWNSDCDINGDNKVDIKDLSMLARTFGKQ